MDSDEDDEDPHIELGTSSTSQPTDPALLNIKDQQQALKDQLSLTTLRMKIVRIVMNTVHRVRIPQRTQYFTVLYVLTNDEHWTMTPETHNCAAAAGSF